MIIKSILKLPSCRLDQSFQRHAVLPTGFDGDAHAAQQDIAVHHPIILGIKQRQNCFGDHPILIHRSTVAHTASPLALSSLLGASACPAVRPSQCTQRTAGHLYSSTVASESIMTAYGSRLTGLGWQRPPVKREDDPAWWDAHHARIEAREKEAKAREPENWPASRQLAILRIKRSAFALDIIAHLEKSTVRAGESDFLWLRQEGYAVRPLGQRYHHLTPYGARAANRVCIAAAKQLSLHHIRYRFDSWSYHSATCTCGWQQTGDRRMNSNWRAPLSAAANKHLADPQDWIRRREASTAIVDTIALIGRGTRDG